MKQRNYLIIGAVVIALIFLMKPFVAGYLYHKHFSVFSEFVRTSLWPEIFGIFVSSYLGKSYGWITAPIVFLFSRIFYAVVDLYYSGTDVYFTHTIIISIFYAFAIALPIGYYISKYRKNIDEFILKLILTNNN